jgi:hypothetical protein
MFGFLPTSRRRMEDPNYLRGNAMLDHPERINKNLFKNKIETYPLRQIILKGPSRKMKKTTEGQGKIIPMKKNSRKNLEPKLKAMARCQGSIKTG